MLTRKSYGKMIEPYSLREAKVIEFMNILAPNLKVITSPINDIYGPTITIEDLDAIIVSTETEGGAKYVSIHQIITFLVLSMNCVK